MFREFEPLGTTAGAIGNGGVLRHTDGTIDFSIYRERARLARAEAIKSSVTGVLRLIGRLFTPGQ